MANEEMGLEAVLRRLIREEIQAALGHLNGHDRLLTAEQAAELLACSPDYLYRRGTSSPLCAASERWCDSASAGSMPTLNQRNLPKFSGHSTDTRKKAVAG
jgi:hypothetical protein